MRVLLINPPNILYREVGSSGIFQPLGLAYVAAALEQAGFEVYILDALAEAWDKFTPRGDGTRLLGLTYEAIGRRVRQLAPQVVGISSLFSVQAESAYLTAQAVKKANPQVITVMGGAHPTVKPLECLEQPQVDFVVRGEGEMTMTQLVTALASGGDPSSILGIGYRKEDGKAHLNPLQPPIRDLDSLPLPARHLLPWESYQQAARSARSARIDTTYGRRWARMVTSRGCPYKCVFCSIHLHMGRRWRARSPEKVVDEIEHLIRDYGVEFINFEDDNMTLNRKRMKRICQLIKERNLKVSWDTPNGVRADSLDEETLRLMKEVGCTRIFVAPESGNQRVVNEVIRKRQDLGKVEAVVRLCQKIGIRVDCFFVIGLIGETKAEIRDTLAFAKKLRRLGATTVNFSIATPYYGTELYEEAQRLGYLRTEGDQFMHTFEPTLETPEFTREEIRKLYLEGLKLNPIISRRILSIGIRMALNDPLRALRIAGLWLRGERLS